MSSTMQMIWASIAAISSMQTTMPGAGDTEMLKSEDQIRLLKLDAAELDRGIIAARKQQPIIPQLDVNIALLKKQLLDAQRRAAELSTALETPDNKTRSATAASQQMIALLI